MDWFKVRPSDIETVDASNEDVGLWHALMSYLTTHELGDDVSVQPSAKKMAKMGLNASEWAVLMASPLILDGKILFYPHGDISAIEKKREAGKRGGAGKHKKNIVKHMVEAESKHMVEAESKHMVGELLTREEKIRLEETREENTKGSSKSNSNDQTHEYPNPFKGCEGQPPKDGTEQSRPVNPEARWQMIQMEPWAMALKTAGCKIGKGSWMQWQDMVERLFQGDAARLADFSRKVDANVRFAGEVESRYVSDHPNEGDGIKEVIA